MKAFLDDNFLLDSDTAQRLYHNHAKPQPIIDYHCHLDPKLIAEDYQFKDLSELWINGDHYKWRVMRTHGVGEKYCTGKDIDNWHKFEKWAETVPYTMRNPLYHWTHLELKSVFEIEKMLKPETAWEIYQECAAKLETKEFSARELMKLHNVEIVCTTDDPIDSLEYHLALKNENFEIKVLPTWRPDKSMAVEHAIEFRSYVERLSEVSNIAISSFTHLLDALRVQHDFFAEMGCKLSDHGIEEFYVENYTDAEINSIFNKVYGGKELNLLEIRKFKSAMLYEGAIMDDEKGWTQQFHYGAIRNNNKRLYNLRGADIGCDSMGDFKIAQNLSKFFDRLDSNDQLAKTILYNLNPKDNDLIASMIGNFQDGSVAGKIQFGASWWFMDHKMGMESQMNSLSNLGLLSHFIGMTTDSRSFLSYSRHEYFRRVLCNLLGTDVEKGLLPASELDFIGQMVENISYNNAKSYLQL